MESMRSADIRQAFLDFFQSKGHTLVPSAPVVVKNDPTLMFTNAGMNQFKDIFLGNSPAFAPRVANTQKCLRVSGKHNDLEEVGVDTYHHTLFEMLGNWSFGDYFKKEAIAWAWELLTGVYKLDKDRLYVTVFEGDKAENLEFDQESFDCWKQWIAEDRILRGNKKDNFWEMGDTGPCGPCTEIHVDLRSEAERKKVPGEALVNTGHPQVIEIWNNVFMEFNRKADGSLENLPARHVDTGMGFERLCMALQAKISNYDTDVFQPTILWLAQKTGLKYGDQEKTDIAMRVIADHIRAIAFCIADGQLPSNNKAGYVIRRILRRAVRYGFTFLNLKEPFLHQLCPLIADQFKDVFPELKAQSDFVSRVIHEEENAFLRTLDTGIRKFENFKGKEVPGAFAFELYDTYGFPIDLTQLMARENGMQVDMAGFDQCMSEQKSRSRKAAEVNAADWVVCVDDEPQFIGYDSLKASVTVLRYRKITKGGKPLVHIAITPCPFYAESGGQVGDSGWLVSPKEKIRVLDTQKENNVILLTCDRTPDFPDEEFVAEVDGSRRSDICRNHSATHLMHSALRQVLGTHVAQKGSLVNEEHTRFDFSHFSKMSVEEIEQVERKVNERIREGIALQEDRNVPIEEARKRGAMALFGEKYGDFVRVITFDPSYSVELCGGTHVKNTSEITFFKIVGESAVAAGIRRVEALTGRLAEEWVRTQTHTLAQVMQLLPQAKDPVKGVEYILSENERLQAQIKALMNEKIRLLKAGLKTKFAATNGIQVLIEEVDLPAEAVKSLSFELRSEFDNMVCLLASNAEGKPHLSLMFSENLVAEKGWSATQLIRDLAKEIQGGGGGQEFYATAGGKKAEGLQSALARARQIFAAS